MESGYLRGGKNNGTNRALKSRLCEAKETQWGCELQYWLYATKLCGAWGVGVRADGPCSPGEKSRVAQETGFIHMKKPKLLTVRSDAQEDMNFPWTFGSLLWVRCDSTILDLNPAVNYATPLLSLFSVSMIPCVTCGASLPVSETETARID